MANSAAMPDQIPILYSFRRCPYAMRARLALASAKITVEHREILLRDKPAAMLRASPRGTVPVLMTDTQIIDESLDIMHWALNRNDPENWLDIPPDGHQLISECDDVFKPALDLYKYASRHPETPSEIARTEASSYLMKLNKLLDGQPFLMGEKPAITDMAIATFVRQFAHVDIDWFTAQPWPNLINWLAAFKASQRFLNIMEKHPIWVQPQNSTPA
ncbi:MAG: glutathione S-transferase [Paracoccaceae bacterium]